MVKFINKMQAVKVINIEKETLIFIGIIISLLGLFLAYRQYQEQKEIWALQKQIHRHEVEQINNESK